VLIEEFDTMNATIRTLVGLGLVALLAGPASAQGRGRGGGFMMDYAALLGNKSVQQELKLDNQQVEKAKDLAEKIGEKRRASFESTKDLEKQERFTKMQELGRELNASALKSAGEFLKPEQITRLKQIHHQVRGVTAFMDPEVQKHLNITDAQKTEIQSIVQESRQQMPSRQDFQDDREAAMKKMQEVNKQTLAKVESKLNDEQQKTWKEMLGSPFEIKYEPRPNN
jgi:hypothetical protein